jgi:poly-gamma-glutamate synthesis protein (capsule biosynthesis protein)
MNHKKHRSWFLVGCLCIVATTFLYKYIFIQKEKPDTWYRAVVPINDSISATPLLFTGDVMLGRYVEKAINEKGIEYLFGERVDELLALHTAIVNLEGPIPKRHVKTPINGFQFSFPTSTVDILNKHSIEAVSLANNHSLDWGTSGYIHTKKVLDDVGISNFGAYSETVPEYFETKLGTTTVIVYGINMISSTWNMARAIEVTKQLRQEHGSAHLIAFIHWGEEYHHNQSVVQRELAHKLIDSGVDTIIGSHPHVVQGIEEYKGKYVFYSLGNFIFDQYFSKETQEGYMLSIDMKGSSIMYTLIPIISVRSKVMVASSTQADSIAQTIADNSSEELRDTIKFQKKVCTPKCEYVLTQ